MAEKYITWPDLIPEREDASRFQRRIELEKTKPRPDWRYISDCENDMAIAERAGLGDGKAWLHKVKHQVERSQTKVNRGKCKWQKKH